MDSDEWAWAMLAQEREQWEADEAAQAEYASWLNLLNELNAKEKNHGTTHI